MVINSVWECWMRDIRREEERRGKEMERREEKKCSEGRTSAHTDAWRARMDGSGMGTMRTRTWRVRIDGLFREWHVRVMCAYARVGLCERHSTSAA